MDSPTFGRLLRTGRKPVGNDEFLEELFSELPPGNELHTVLARIPGDPAAPDLDRRLWGGMAWRPGLSTSRLGLRGEDNNYLTISAFKRSPDGRRRRVKAAFAQLCAVMLDDLGPKLDPNLITLPLSAAVVTSPGNVQGWYFVRNNAAAQDLATCEALISAMVERGFAQARDPGMKGVTRLGRLPVGRNLKPCYEGGFDSKLVLWEPQRRYTVVEIARAYGLMPLRVARIPKRIALNANEERRYGRQFHALLRTLSDAGMVKALLPGGRYDVRCPWIHEHTSRADNGAMLFAPSPNNDGRGGWKCQHGHCERRTLWDVKKWSVERGMAALQKKLAVRPTLKLKMTGTGDAQ